MIKVVHCKLERYDVYIGRGQGSIWGNPFSHKYGTIAKYRVNSLAAAIESYRQWILGNPTLLARLPELKDKILGCWCAGYNGLTINDRPYICHGQVLLELANKE